MRIPRRQFLHLAAVAAAPPALPRMACAHAYPTRPVRIVSVSAAGGTSDILARLIGQWLSERLGQPFVIENRPGAGGNIAAEVVVRAPPNGYTLLLVGSNAMISASLYDKLNYSLVRDIAPIASVSREPHIMLVNPSVPAKTVPEFIAYAKVNPGKINMASAGNGSGPHMVGELFKMMTGIDMVHVPYRGGGPALNDLLSGRVQVLFPGVTASIGHIRAGTLRALAVTTATRAEELPDIPSMGEIVPGYDASTVFGLGAPMGTPTEIVYRLNSEINAGLADPKLRSRLADLGANIFPSSPSDFGKLIAAEIEKWGNVVRFSGAKAD